MHEQVAPLVAASLLGASVGIGLYFSQRHCENVNEFDKKNVRVHSLLHKMSASKDASAFTTALKAAAINKEDIEKGIDAHGRTLLHKAAHRGHPDIVHMLIDMDVDVNQWATGQYVYGKTPIFFAITRCRDDIVQALLKAGATLRIVNNKGQSPLSLAASHLRQDTIDLMIVHEEQEEREWLNFRATHSDGLMYGDLDPRFLEGSNVMLQGQARTLSVKATTHTSRRTNFLTNNPHLAPGRQPKKKTKPKKEKKRKKMSSPSQEEIEQAWMTIEDLLASPGEHDGLPSALDALSTLLDSGGAEWVGEAAGRLRRIATEGNVLPLLVSILTEMKQQDEKEKEKEYEPPIPEDGKTRLASKDRKRIKKTQRLRQRLLERALNERRCAPPSPKGVPRTKQPRVHPQPEERVALKPYILAGKISWVGDISSTQQMMADIEVMVTTLNEDVSIGLDTEWTGSGEHMRIAVIQLALLDRTWVCDALMTDASAPNGLFTHLSALFASPGLRILGFGLEGDMRLLARLGIIVPPASIVDLQTQVIKYGLGSSKQRPSLKRAVAALLGKRLDKAQQRSNWAARPLSETQLIYAAIDAAVLLQLEKASR